MFIYISIRSNQGYNITKPPESGDLCGNITEFANRAKMTYRHPK